MKYLCDCDKHADMFGNTHHLTDGDGNIICSYEDEELDHLWEFLVDPNERRGGLGDAIVVWTDEELERELELVERMLPIQMEAFRLNEEAIRR